MKYFRKLQQKLEIDIAGMGYLWSRWGKEKNIKMTWRKLVNKSEHVWTAYKALAYIMLLIEKSLKQTNLPNEIDAIASLYSSVNLVFITDTEAGLDWTTFHDMKCFIAYINGVFRTAKQYYDNDCNCSCTCSYVILDETDV